MIAGRPGIELIVNMGDHVADAPASWFGGSTTLRIKLPDRRLGGACFRDLADAAKAPLYFASPFPYSGAQLGGEQRTLIRGSQVRESAQTESLNGRGLARFPSRPRAKHSSNLHKGPLS